MGTGLETRTGFWRLFFAFNALPISVLGKAPQHLLFALPELDQTALLPNLPAASEIPGTTSRRTLRRSSTGQLWVFVSARSGRNSRIAHRRRGVAPSERSRIAGEAFWGYWGTPGGCTQPDISDPQDGQLATPLDGLGLRVDTRLTCPPTSWRVQWIPFQKEGYNEGTAAG